MGRLLPLPYTSIKRPSAPPTHLPGGADGQEGVGPAGEHSLPVDQQHADVVLALRLQGAVSTGITGLGLAASRRPVAASAGPLILFVNDSEGGQTIFLTGRFTVAGGGWRVSILMLILGSKYIRHKSSSVRSAGRGESYQTLKQSSRSVSQLATSQRWGNRKNRF